MNNSNSTFNQSGDFRNAILNIQSTLTNVTQTVNTIPHGTNDNRQQLEDLIQQLKEALETVPEENVKEAEVVAALTEDLVSEAKKEAPMAAMLQIKGENLKKAAENLAAVTPIVLPIAAQVVALISKFVAA